MVRVLGAGSCSWDLAFSVCYQLVNWIRIWEGGFRGEEEDNTGGRGTRFPATPSPSLLGKIKFMFFSLDPAEASGLAQVLKPTKAREYQWRRRVAC